MANFVNLSGEGELVQAGRNYGHVAEDKGAEARNFDDRMAASQQGLRGAAGTTFTNTVAASSSNLTQLGNQIADQAVRAVRAENTIVDGDSQANTAQNPTLSTMDAQSSALAFPITTETR